MHIRHEPHELDERLLRGSHDRIECGREHKHAPLERLCAAMSAEECIQFILKRALSAPPEHATLFGDESRCQTVPLPLRKHHYVRPEQTRHIEYGEHLFTAQSVFIAFAFFTYKDKPVDDVVHMGEITKLCPWRHYRERLAFLVLFLEDRYERRIRAGSPLARTEHVIKIRDRIRQSVPFAVILHELGIRGFAPRVWRCVARKTAIAEFRTRAGVDEFAPALAPEFKDRLCAHHIEVPHYMRLLDALFHARVFAEMIDEVHLFLHKLFNVFRVAFAVFRAVHMVVFRAGKIIVYHENAVALCEQAPDQVCAHKTGPAGHQNKPFPWSLHAGTLHQTFTIFNHDFLPCLELTS